MENTLRDIRERVLGQIAEAKATADLEQIRVSVLGKKGELTGLLRGMGKLPPEERPKVGQMVNEVRAALEGALEEREYLRALACGDLYFPVADQPDKAALLTDLFFKTTDAFNSRSFTYRMESRAWLSLMISEVIGNAVTEEEAPPDVNYRRIQPALDYIEAHYAEHIVLSDLSALLNVSEDHFIRLFKRVTRRTPFSYILDYRIEQALKLLGGDEYSISQISDMTGFSNVQYFSQAFKSRVGVSPSIYRNPKRPF